MARHLDEHVAAFRNRPLDAGPYAFVWADALTQKVRKGGRIINVHALIAVGVNADSHREILGLDVRFSARGDVWSGPRAESWKRLVRSGGGSARSVIYRLLRAPGALCYGGSSLVRANRPSWVRPAPLAGHIDADRDPGGFTQHRLPGGGRGCRRAGLHLRPAQQNRVLRGGRTSAQLL